MQGNINTAIFVEVIGTPTNWYLGYSTPFRFHSAKIYVNGSGQPWQQQHKHTAHHCGAIGTYPVDDAVKGTAITGGIGRFRLEGVPPRCP